MSEALGCGCVCQGVGFGRLVWRFLNSWKTMWLPIHRVERTCFAMGMVYGCMGSGDFWGMVSVTFG